MSGGSSMYALRTRASRIATALSYSAWSRSSRRVCDAEQRRELVEPSASRRQLRLERRDACLGRRRPQPAHPRAPRPRPRAATSARPPAASTRDLAPAALRCARRRPPSRSSMVAGGGGAGGDERERQPGEREGVAVPFALVSLAGWSTLPRISGSSACKRRRHLAAQRADLRSVVLVRDRPGAMVELELLERRRAHGRVPRGARAGAARRRRARRARRTRARARGGTAARPRRRRRRRAPRRARNASVNALRAVRPRTRARRAFAARDGRARA